MSIQLALGRIKIYQGEVIYLSLFLFALGKVYGEFKRMAEDCERWRFALADRGLDYEINLPVTVSVMNLQKSPDRKGLGIEIILQQLPCSQRHFSCLSLGETIFTYIKLLMKLLNTSSSELALLVAGVIELLVWTFGEGSLSIFSRLVFSWAIVLIIWNI